jgi:hypothetical protein
VQLSFLTVLCGVINRVDLIRESRRTDMLASGLGLGVMVRPVHALGLDGTGCHRHRVILNHRHYLGGIHFAVQNANQLRLA